MRARAVRVTVWLFAYVAEHVAPQLIPRGRLTTTPLPDVVTVSVGVCDGSNVAVTAVVELSVTVQVPVPVQPAPLQPENAEPTVGVAVNVTAVPATKVEEQLAPQAIPAGALLTVPFPDPAFTTPRPKDCSAVPHATLE